MQSTVRPAARDDVKVSEADTRRKERSLLEYGWVTARGFAMGSADVVPGVSGGTMAFILGIYQELIESIRAVGQREFLQSVLRVRVAKALRILNWKFLLALSVGIVAAVISLAPQLEWLLENRPVMLWSFFFGLVGASVIVVAQRIMRWTPLILATLAIGTVVAFIIVGLVPVETPSSWWFLMLSGAIAICAMILPGISGSFILVLLSKYEFFLNAVNTRDLVSIALAGVGALIGLVTFAQVLGWLFKRYHDLTVALLTGLMIGSLRKVWPWKETLAFFVDEDGERVPLIQNNILPELTVNGSFNMEIASALGLVALGFVLVIVLEWLGSRADEEVMG